MEKQENRWRE